MRKRSDLSHSEIRGYKVISSRPHSGIPDKTNYMFDPCACADVRRSRRGYPNDCGALVLTTRFFTPSVSQSNFPKCNLSAHIRRLPDGKCIRNLIARSWRRSEKFLPLVIFSSLSICLLPSSCQGSITRTTFPCFSPYLLTAHVSWAEKRSSLAFLCAASLYSFMGL